MKRKVLSLVLFFSMCVLLTACGKAVDNGSKKNGSDSKKTEQSYDSGKTAASVSEKKAEETASASSEKEVYKPEIPAEEYWVGQYIGTYRDEEYGFYRQAAMEIQVNDVGLIEAKITTKDGTFSLELEVKDEYVPSAYTGGDESALAFLNGSTYKPRLQYVYEESRDTSWVTFTDPTEEYFPEGEIQFFKYLYALRTASSDYKDADPTGKLESILASPYLKTISDDFIAFYHYNKDVVTENEKGTMHHPVDYCTIHEFDENDMRTYIRDAIICQSPEDAAAIYHYYTTDLFVAPLVQIEGSVVYLTTDLAPVSRKTIWIDLVNYEVYPDKHYAKHLYFDTSPDSANDVAYISKPRYTNAVPFEEAKKLIFWAPGVHPALDGPDPDCTLTAKFEFNRSHCFAEAALVITGNDFQFLNAGTQRYLGDGKFVEIWYNYLHGPEGVFIYEYEIADTTATVTEKFYERDRDTYKNIDITLDNYTSFTPGAVITRTFDMTTIKE